MNATIIAALIGLFGSISGVYIANRWQARTARRVAEAQEDVATQELQVNVWHQQYEAWKADAIALREQRDADQQRYEADRNRFEQRFAEMAQEMEGLKARVSTLTRERAEEQAYVEALIAWCRVVVRLLQQAGIAYPPLPAGVSDTDPRGIPRQ